MTYSSKELLANGVAPEVVMIRKWRRQHKLTQDEMAAMVGVSKDHLNEVETGKRLLCAYTRGKLTAFLDRWHDK